jgi:hypothetical protein
MATQRHPREPATVQDIIRHLKGVLIAIVALALSASLVFGAQAPAAGFALGSSFQGTDESAGVAGDEDANEAEDTETDETTDETTDGTTDETTDGTSESADNCLTDPTGLTEVELAAMSHGSIVCWAAHQTTPDGYANHGAWVSHWAHMGKGKDVAADAAATGKSHGKGKGLTKGS